MTRLASAAVWTVAALFLAPVAMGQSLSDRIKEYRSKSQKVSVETETRGVNVELAMRDIIQDVQIEDVPARRAFQWWSLTTGVPLVINWAALEAEGIDADMPMTLHLKAVPAGQLLSLMLQRITPELSTLMYNSTPWYVEVSTREQALRKTVVRVYVIEDLLLTIPRFNNSPKFNLNDALSNTNSGGSSGAEGVAQASTGIFDRDQNQNPEPQLSKEERGEQLAELIRDTIEPDIWQTRGGQYSSVRYFHGRLIVNAPLFVHAQIGIPTAGSGTSSGMRATGYRGPNLRGVARVADQ